MNYHDYDSHGNKKKINFSGLWDDKTSRSRIILFIYLLLFAILIIYVRLNTNVADHSLDNNTDNVIEKDKDEDKEVEENQEIKELFSALSNNNYNFNYLLTFDNEDYKYVGKRFSNKIMYDFSSFENNLGSYISDGNLTKVKLLEGDYEISDSPYYGFNYFEINILKEMLKDSNKISENIYEITNEKFDKYYDKHRHFITNINKDLTNEIKLETKNGKIVGINIDYTNYAKNDSSFEFSSVKISLKYSDFDLIDDFSIDFK